MSIDGKKSSTQEQKRKFLVTGGSRGIGLEIAKDLVASGNSVWICGHSPIQPSLSKSFSNADVEFSQVDVASESSVAGLFSSISEKWGYLDGVVHSAAILGETGKFWDLSCKAMMDALSVNVAGAFNVTKAYVNLRQGAVSPAARGKVILFAGGGAGYGYPGFLPYGTSKAAVVRMCETISMELDAAILPIDVNVIAPGANETEMLKKVRAAGGEVRTVVPFSKPIAICNWLLSQESDGVTGRFFHVNDNYREFTPSALKKDSYTLRRTEL